MVRPRWTPLGTVVVCLYLMLPSRPTGMHGRTHDVGGCEIVYLLNVPVSTISTFRTMAATTRVTLRGRPGPCYETEDIDLATSSPFPYIIVSNTRQLAKAQRNPPGEILFLRAQTSPLLCSVICSRANTSLSIFANPCRLEDRCTPRHVVSSTSQTKNQKQQQRNRD